MNTGHGDQWRSPNSSISPKLTQSSANLLGLFSDTSIPGQSQVGKEQEHPCCNMGRGCTFPSEMSSASSSSLLWGSSNPPLTLGAHPGPSWTTLWSAGVGECLWSGALTQTRDMFVREEKALRADRTCFVCRRKAHDLSVEFSGSRQIPTPHFLLSPAFPTLPNREGQNAGCSPLSCWHFPSSESPCLVQEGLAGLLTVGSTTAWARQSECKRSLPSCTEFPPCCLGSCCHWPREQTQSHAQRRLREKRSFYSGTCYGVPKPNFTPLKAPFY